MQLRPYQQDAIDAILDFWAEGGGNPLVDLATGLGKSVIVGSLLKTVLTQYPTMRALVLVHVRELVEQDYLALRRVWPDAPAGIYSAGLGRRDAHHKVTVASIQSVYQRAKELGPRPLVLIDEAHLVPNAGEGMYRRLLDDLRDLDPETRIAGFTATPYRMDSGRLDDKDALFDQTVYSYGIRQGIEAGYLSPLISKRGIKEIDVSGINLKGGEFAAGQLEAAADQDELTMAAVGEIVSIGASRRSWLIFASGIKHAYHVRDAVRLHGVSCEAVTSETPAGDRARIFAAHKAGHLRSVVGMNTFTTGYDAPIVDLIASLRSTLSKNLWVQIVGRGTRLAEGKENCLVLDYGGNLRRHGPVDMIEVDPRRKGGSDETKVKVDDVRSKTCPECEHEAGLSARFCQVCGHEWPRDETPKHAAFADDVPILSSEMPDRLTVNEHEVAGWTVKAWSKEGARDTVRVTYMAGLQAFNHWICPEHADRPRWKFERFWAEHGGLSPAPSKVSETIVRFAELTPPHIIQTRPNGRWVDIVGWRHARPAQEEAA